MANLLVRLTLLLVGLVGWMQNRRRAPNPGPALETAREAVREAEGR